MKKLKNILSSLILSISLIPYFTTQVFADKLSDASNQAATGIQASAQGAAKYLLIIVIVIFGIALAFGSARHKEAVKDKAPWVIVGLALIVGAVAISQLIFSWF